MAEFTYSASQTVPYRQAAILNSTSCRCSKGYILHREGSGLVTLRGIVNNQCSSFARYEVKYSCNIALSEGETVGEIGVALVLNGEVLQDTIAVATPAAVGNRWNVSGFVTIDVPRGCCPSVSLENISVGETTNPNIDMTNLNVDVRRTA